MRPGMFLFQSIGCPARTDERKNVHVRAFHEGRDNLGAAAVNEIDHAGRKACRKGTQQGLMHSTPNFAGFTTVVLPMMSAGISVVYISFKG